MRPFPHLPPTSIVSSCARRGRLWGDSLHSRGAPHARRVEPRRRQGLPAIAGHREGRSTSRHLQPPRLPAAGPLRHESTHGAGIRSRVDAQVCGEELSLGNRDQGSEWRIRHSGPDVGIAVSQQHEPARFREALVLTTLSAASGRPRSLSVLRAASTHVPCLSYRST